MEFIPYQRLTIATDLSKDEVVSRLRNKIGPTKRENFVRVDKNIFSGQLVGDRFELSLITDYRNSWTPEITGTILESDKSTDLAVTLRSNIFVIVFTAVFMFFGLSMLIYEIFNLRDSHDFDWMTLMFIIFPYGLCWFGFNLDADRSIDGLIKITKGEIK